MRKRIKKPRFGFRFPHLTMIDKNELFFFLSYGIYLIYMVLNTTFFAIYINSVWKIVYVFCIGLLVVGETIRNGMTWKSLLTLGIILLLFINILRVGQGLLQNAAAALMIYIFCSRKISFRKIGWFTILVSSTVLAFVVICSLVGVIPNYTSGGERRRQYLGFLYALFGPTLMSNITLLWIYCKKDKISVKSVAVFLILNFYFFKRTDSRLCFYLTVAMLLFSLFLRKHQKLVLRRRFLCFGMILSFPLAAAISFLLTIHYQPSVTWMSSLNHILESRLSLGKTSLERFGINPFGIHGIKWVGNALNMYGEKNTADAYLSVDSYYIQIAQRFGFVFLIIILTFLTIACYNAYKKKDIYLLSIFCLLAIHFIIDDLYMYLHYNTFWLAAGMLFFSKSKKLCSQSFSFSNMSIMSKAVYKSFHNT